MIYLALRNIKEFLSRVASAERAGRIARGLQSANLIPVLSFTADQAVRCLDAEMFHVLVLDAVATTTPEWSRVIVAAGRNTVPILSVGDIDSEFAGDVDHWVVGSEFEEIVSGAVRLTLLERPVRAPTVSWGGLRLDVAKRQARWNSDPLNLTVTEFRIMEVLAFAAGALVTVGDLVRRVWDTDSFDDAERVLAHVRRIRRKIEPDPSRPMFLLTVRGQGYRLRGDDEELAMDSIRTESHSLQSLRNASAMN